MEVSNVITARTLCRSVISASVALCGNLVYALAAFVRSGVDSSNLSLFDGLDKSIVVSMLGERLSMAWLHMSLQRLLSVLVKSSIYNNVQAYSAFFGR